MRRRRGGPTFHVATYVTGAASESGDRLAVGTAEGIVIFDGTTRTVPHTFADIGLRSANVVAGNRLVAVSGSGQMTVYDLHTFEALATNGRCPRLRVRA